MAAEASAIVSAIRFEEQQTIWTPDYEDSLAKGNRINVHPGMMFTLARERMAQTKLWKIVKKMPKGALLHCHLQAMCDLEYMIQLIFETEGVCIRSKTPLNTAQARQSSPFLFCYSKTAASEETESIWADTYTTGQPINITKAAGAFPGDGKEGFIKWLQSRVTITPEESLQHHLGPNDIWRKFVSIFPILGKYS